MPDNKTIPRDSAKAKALHTGYATSHRETLEDSRQHRPSNLRDAALSSHRHPGCAQRPRPPTFASSSQRRSVFGFDDGNFPGLGERSHAPGSRLGSPTLGRDAEPEPPAGSEATGEWGGCPGGLGGDAVTPGPRNEHSPSRSPAPASRDATLRVMTSCACPAHSSSRRPGPRPAPRDDVSIHSTRSG
ncbi:extended synaptotagmin-2-like [Symphalangus syndactylus]|uniref:extended synaptotagmin-2-like n=1 Tax=Symphalangus syndactylus TaxID=9590 RepID=UPI0030064187